jgi:hypothetical protein
MPFVALAEVVLVPDARVALVADRVPPTHGDLIANLQAEGLCVMTEGNNTSYAFMSNM